MVGKPFHSLLSLFSLKKKNWKKKFKNPPTRCCSFNGKRTSLKPNHQFFVDFFFFSCFINDISVNNLWDKSPFSYIFSNQSSRSLCVYFSFLSLFTASRSNSEYVRKLTRVERGWDKKFIQWLALTWGATGGNSYPPKESGP